jgi:hypothetical protein
MRALTPKETEELERRRARFEQFLAERMPVLAEFAEALDLENPPMIVADPDRYLPSIDAFMRRQLVEPEHRVWILTRLGYLVGEVLVQRLSGCWLLNDIPDSRYFLRYVVGQFATIRNPNAMVDPFAVADAFIGQPLGRDLTAMVAEVESELRTA